MGLVVLLIVFGAMYALLIIPQQRRAKAQRELIASLEPGDEVVTNAGIYGAIAEVEGEVIWLEVAPDIELKVLKSAVTGKVEETAEGAGEGDADDADDVDEVDAEDEHATANDESADS